VHCFETTDCVAAREMVNGGVKAILFSPKDMPYADSWVPGRPTRKEQQANLPNEAIRTVMLAGQIAK